VGTSYVDYRGRGFWTRDAALETLLGLLIAELEPLSGGDQELGAVLDRWSLQATAGFNAEIISAEGGVSPQCDILIVDRSTPQLTDSKTHRIVPAECVYGVVEVKSQLNSKETIDGCEKIAKVKRLARTAYVVQRKHRWTSADRDTLHIQSSAMSSPSRGSSSKQLRNASDQRLILNDIALKYVTHALELAL